MGSFCVVKSTKLDPANGGSLGTVVLFPPAQAAEAQEYSAILVRVDASRLPASPLDAARLTALEVLSSKTLDDIDSEGAIKLMHLAMMDSFGSPAAAVGPIDPAIGFKFVNVPYVDSVTSVVSFFANGTVTSADLLHLMVTDDADPTRTSMITRVSAAQYPPAAPAVNIMAAAHRFVP